MPEISDEQVVKLVPALAEAARADRRTAARFVPPRTGILEETASRRHQFVFGRRGVGKSTLLRKIESAATDSDVEVIFVDIETLRGRPYPDVLIELLIQLLDALENRLASVPRHRVVVRLRRRATLGRIRTLRQALRALLDQPQTAERTIRELSARHTRAGVAGSVEVSSPRAGRVGAAAEHAVRSEQETTSEATFVRSKMDGLLGAAVLIRSALGEAQEQLGDTACLIVLDDFYHVPYDDQADLLAYLHQTVKNLDIFLSRSRPRLAATTPATSRPCARKPSGCSAVGDGGARTAPVPSCASPVARCWSSSKTTSSSSLSIGSRGRFARPPAPPRDRPS